MHVTWWCASPRLERVECRVGLHLDIISDQTAVAKTNKRRSNNAVIENAKEKQIPK